MRFRARPSAAQLFAQALNRSASWITCAAGPSAWPGLRPPSLTTTHPRPEVYVAAMRVLTEARSRAERVQPCRVRQAGQHRPAASGGPGSSGRIRWWPSAQSPRAETLIREATGRDPPTGLELGPDRDHLGANWRHEHDRLRIYPAILPGESAPGRDRTCDHRIRRFFRHPSPVIHPRSELHEWLLSPLASPGPSSLVCGPPAD